MKLLGIMCRDKDRCLICIESTSDCYLNFRQTPPLHNLCCRHAYFSFQSKRRFGPASLRPTGTGNPVWDFTQPNTSEFEKHKTVILFPFIIIIKWWRISVWCGLIHLAEHKVGELFYFITLSHNMWILKTLYHLRDSALNVDPDWLHADCGRRNMIPQKFNASGAILLDGICFCCDLTFGHVVLQ